MIKILMKNNNNNKLLFVKKQENIDVVRVLMHVNYNRIINSVVFVYTVIIIIIKCVYEWCKFGEWKIFVHLLR